MTDKYKIRRLFRDGETRIFIPDLNIIATDLVTNIVSSYITDPVKNSNGFFSFNDRFNDPINWDSGVKRLIEFVMDTLFLGIGVTEIKTFQEYVMPFSKGIGSTGEVIHLLGAKNELINLEFTTDRYPGKLGYVLRTIIKKILETAQVVYLVDDLFLTTPCLIKKVEMSKKGLYRGAVIGELELVSLLNEGIFDQYADKLKKSLKPKVEALINRNSRIANLTKSIIGKRNFIIKGSLLVGILG